MSSLPSRSIAVVLGTRPEIIKLAPVIRQLGDAARVVHSGQHYDPNLSGVFFDVFGIPAPVETIDVGGRSRGTQIGVAVSALTDLFERERPVAVLVQGDTNTTVAGSLAANAAQIPLVHLEAGLRSYDRAMPEEHNRVLADHLADLLLAPTAVSRSNLARESIPDERIRVIGNTVVEAVTTLLLPIREQERVLDDLDLESEGFVLSTFHRPENVDDPATFATVLSALDGAELPVVLPLHPRSRARATGAGLLGGLRNVRVVDPLDYPTFLGLLARCAFAVSDSGGVQEEVSVLKRFVVVVRRSTERPEVLGTFATRVAPGDDLPRVIASTAADAGRVRAKLADIPTPYGDGSSARLASDAIHRLIQT